MKRLSNICRFGLWSGLLTLMLTACGEDRSGEYYALIEKDVWVEEMMRTHYLWYDHIPEVTESAYFAEPADFLKKLVYSQALDGKGDSFSYIKENETATDAAATRSLYLDQTSTYGFDFELLTDPLGTSTKLLARVLFVLPDSPASQAGLQRGDWILMVNGTSVTTSNYGYLIQGDGVMLTRAEATTDEEGYDMWATLDDVTLGASRSIECNPLYLDSLYTVDHKKIAYLVYDRFEAGPTGQDDDDAYCQQMTQLFQRFKQQQPDAFILDLRYNPGGLLRCARQLASLLAPASALGKTCYTLQYNDLADPQYVSAPLGTEYAEANLDLQQVYILTSKYTASASEAVINCLRPYMGTDQVITLGETTYGKPVAMQAYPYADGSFTLWPVTSYVLNADGQADYASGITPLYPLSERAQLTLYPLGDTRELLLGNAISLITTGQLTNPDPDEGVGPEVESQTRFSTLSLRARNGRAIE